MPAALAAKPVTRSRVGLHQDGRRAVLVHAAPERRNLAGFISLREETTDKKESNSTLSDRH